LSSCHDDGEDEWAIGRDRVKNEKLSCGRSDGQNNCVPHEIWVSEEEPEGGCEVARLNQRPHCKEAREEIDTKHHLELGHLVLLEQPGLVVGRETVEEEIAEKENDSNNLLIGLFRWGVWSLRLAKGEQRYSDGQTDVDRIFPHLVFGAVQKLSH